MTQSQISNKLKDKIKDSFKEFGDKGYRVIGIAYKLIEKRDETNKAIVLQCISKFYQW